MIFFVLDSHKTDYLIPSPSILLTYCKLDLLIKCPFQCHSSLNSALLRLSFSNLRESLHLLHTLVNFGLYFEPYITNYFTDFSFLHLSQVWRLWSWRTSHGAVILLSSSLIHRCRYVDSKPSFFLLIFWNYTPYMTLLASRRFFFLSD